MNNNFNNMNFFYSANSEAYQDAFLTWIFYNFYNDNSLDQSDIEVKNFSKFMLKNLVPLKNDDEIITEVEPDTQVKNSDIILKITTTNNEYLVIIEDKTGSSIHPSKKTNKKKDNDYYPTQLEKYYDKFLNDKALKRLYEKYFEEGRVFLYYYKNEFVTEYEERVIDGANDACEKLLRKHYNDIIDSQIKDLRKKEEKINKRIDYLKDYPKKTKPAIEKQQNELTEKIKELNNNKSIIDELESTRDKIIDNKIEENYNKWTILGINKIYDLFRSFINEGDFKNLILKDYYQSIKFWHNQYEINEEKVLYEDNDPEFLWNEQSQIWNSIFEKVMKKVIKESPEKRYVVNKYNGNYWQGSLISDNNVTCLLISPRKIVKDNNTVKIDITLNLRNEKYNDEVPWKNKKERENHRVAIVEKLNKSLGEGWVINQKPKKDEDDDRNDTNLLATYSVSVESSKATVDFLSDKAFNTTIKDLKCIEEYTVNNQKQKIFI